MKVDNVALPVLEQLFFGPSSLLTEASFNVQHLEHLNILEFSDMPREFVLSMQPGGQNYWKVQHVPSVRFWGELYDIYKLGELDLIKRLQG